MIAIVEIENIIIYVILEKNTYSKNMTPSEALNKIKKDFDNSKDALLTSEFFQRFSPELSKDQPFIAHLKESLGINKLGGNTLDKIKHGFELSQEALMNSKFYRSFGHQLNNDSNIVFNLKNRLLDNDVGIDTNPKDLMAIQEILEQGKPSDEGTKKRFKLKH